MGVRSIFYIGWSGKTVDNVIFEQRPEGNEGVSHVEI